MPFLPCPPRRQSAPSRRLPSRRLPSRLASLRQASFRLALTATAAAIPLALAGCGPASRPRGTATPKAGAPASGCTADYCVPADWDTAPASAPLTQIRPFVEPLNVVIGARSTVSLSVIQRALDDWDTVSSATTVNVTGIHLRCISTERADVTGQGFTTQQAAWRLDGCAGGNELSLSGNEAHVRIWHQPVPGSRYGAWFVAASYETMCLVRNGRLQTVSANKVWAALHPANAYHCVDGGPGTFHSAHPDGYDDGARDFAAAVTAAARSRGWQVSQRIAVVPRREHAGEGGVPFSDDLYVLTVRS